MSKNDTPIFWRKYLNYIDKWNEDMQAEMDSRQILDHDEYKALPWYMKLVKQDPSDFTLNYFFWSKEPNIVDYYNWDVRINRKGKK